MQAAHILPDTPFSNCDVYRGLYGKLNHFVHLRVRRHVHRAIISAPSKLPDNRRKASPVALYLLIACASFIHIYLYIFRHIILFFFLFRRLHVCT